MENLEQFKILGLSNEALRVIKNKGFTEPTPIQKKCIPLVFENKFDLIGQAQTGTGKTAAFGLPIIEMLDPQIKKVQVLILTPTRELAIQVAGELNSLKGKKNLTIFPVYGGQSIETQIKRLKKGIHIVVGTPGRIIDHLNRKTLKLNNLKFAILDEADEMLNMGFIEDMETILSHTPEKKRTMLFSATMPPRIIQLAEKYMSDYKYITVKKKQLTVELTDQIYYELREKDKFEALTRIIDVEPEFYGLVFCRTKVDVDKLSNKLMDKGYEAEGLHGDYSQNLREKILKKFRDKKVKILVATDVAARGLDVKNLTHVINYNIPEDPERYVHRIGRTGRAGKKGTAITFVTPSEFKRLAFIKRIIKTSIKKEVLPDTKKIIEKKKDLLKEKIKQTIENNEQDKFNNFVSEIIKEYEPEKIIAALLQISFQNEFDHTRYGRIKKVSFHKKNTRKKAERKYKKDYKFRTKKSKH